MRDGLPSPVERPTIPPRTLDVPPARVRGNGGGSRSAVLAVTLTAAVIGAGLVAASLSPSVPPTPATLRAPTPGPSTATLASPAPIGVSIEIPPRLSVPQLQQGMLDGTLEGRLVFIDGVLIVRPAPCEDAWDPAGGCVHLTVYGLGLPVRAGPADVPWRGAPAPGAWLVTVATGDALVYLGSLLPRRGEPESIDALTQRFLEDPAGEPRGTLFEASGWLLANPLVSCSGRVPGATPCPAAATPFLADDEPLAGWIVRSSRGGSVGLAASPVDLDPAEAVTHGTFLVERQVSAPCRPPAPSVGCPDDRAGWRVVARYRPSRSVRVLAP